MSINDNEHLKKKKIEKKRSKHFEQSEAFFI